MANELESLHEKQVQGVRRILQAAREVAPPVVVFGIALFLFAGVVPGAAAAAGAVGALKLLESTGFSAFEALLGKFLDSGLSNEEMMGEIKDILREVDEKRLRETLESDRAIQMGVARMLERQERGFQQVWAKLDRGTREVLRGQMEELNLFKEEFFDRLREMDEKADRRHTEVLERLDRLPQDVGRAVGRMPAFQPDYTPPPPPLEGKLP